jgi:hypothetical protein
VQLSLLERAVLPVHIGEGDRLVATRPSPPTRARMVS